MKHTAQKQFRKVISLLLIALMIFGGIPIALQIGAIGTTETLTPEEESDYYSDFFDDEYGYEDEYEDEYEYGYEHNHTTEDEYDSEESISLEKYDEYDSAYEYENVRAMRDVEIVSLEDFKSEAMVGFNIVPRERQARQGDLVYVDLTMSLLEEVIAQGQGWTSAVFEVKYDSTRLEAVAAYGSSLMAPDPFHPFAQQMAVPLDNETIRIMFSSPINIMSDITVTFMFRVLDDAEDGEAIITWAPVSAFGGTPISGVCPVTGMIIIVTYREPSFDDYGLIWIGAALEYDVIYDLNSSGAMGGPMPGTVTVPNNTTYNLRLGSSYNPAHVEAADGRYVLFMGWSLEQAEILDVGDAVPAFVTDVTINGADVFVYAVWGYSTDGETPDIERGTYNVTFDFGLDYAVFVPNVPFGGQVHSIPQAPTRPNQEVSHWTLNGAQVDPLLIIITEATTFVAVWRTVATVSPGAPGWFTPPGINTSEPDSDLTPVTGKHIGYIRGFPDGTVRPDTHITRAEAAMIFFRLLDDGNKFRPVEARRFQDVDGISWYSQAVNYLAQINVLTGYTDGTFRPDAIITRAEFATMTSKFFEVITPVIALNSFTDVDYHWARDYINAAFIGGWIQGYGDGTFRPDNHITRAEAVTLVNRAFGRIPNPATIRNNIGNQLIYVDLLPTHWANYGILEASIDHKFKIDDFGNEIWTWFNIR